MCCLYPGQRQQLRALYSVRNARPMRLCKEHLQHKQLNKDSAAIILCVLSVELIARPRIFRFVEWVIACLLPARLGKKLTLGPFQITGGPFNLKAATEEALSLLTTASPQNLQEVAQFWNGTASDIKPRLDLWSYSEMLHIAYAIAHLRPSWACCGKCSYPECGIVQTLRNS